MKSRFPVTLVRTSYREGQRLPDIQYEFDGDSYRYAVVNVAATDADSIERDLIAVREHLGFRLDLVG